MNQKFVFTLPQFEGSLDLLLYLVQKHEMDIRDIEISTIADEFLNYINQMKKLDINVASDFMVTASTLMELKSKILLPNKSDEEIEKIKRAKQELSERLIAYQQMKELAKKFKKRLDESLKLHSVKVKKGKEEIIVKADSLSRLKDLFEHVSKVIKSREKVYKIRSERYSVANKMQEVYEKLEKKNRMSLEEVLLWARDRIELIVIFLAVLELVKLNKTSLTVSDGEYLLEVIQ